MGVGVAWQLFGGLAQFVQLVANLMLLGRHTSVALPCSFCLPFLTWVKKNTYKHEKEERSAQGPATKAGASSVFGTVR